MGDVTQGLLVYPEIQDISAEVISVIEEMCLIRQEERKGKSKKTEAPGKP